MWSRRKTSQLAIMEVCWSKQPMACVGTQRRGVQINLESGVWTSQKKTACSLFLKICLSIWMNKGVAGWHTDWEVVITGWEAVE